MKITELFEAYRLALTNEERKFLKQYGDAVPFANLDEHAIWVAQNLVRKGMYEISNDSKQLVKKHNVFYLRPSI